MLHMHDLTHTLNVLRHWQSSWLSREIIFGILFAGA
ncbi:MAG TPA: dimethylsulfoxide reductase, partial [Propionibacterium sp.]|nr:dimethylsulfoxide reductase [Propionibacterium sp.]